MGVRPWRCFSIGERPDYPPALRRTGPAKGGTSVAVLEILSGCSSSRDLEAFARRHCAALNQALAGNFKRCPSDATFFYLFNQADLQEFGQVLQAWMIAQIPGGAEGLDQLVLRQVPTGALRLRAKTAGTASLPRSTSTLGLLASPWPKRPTTPPQHTLLLSIICYVDNGWF
jgi:hypothetical protein